MRWVHENNQHNEPEVMSGNLQRGPKPAFDREKVFAEVDRSNHRFEQYSRETRSSFVERARGASAVKPHAKVRCP